MQMFFQLMCSAFVLVGLGLLKWYWQRRNMYRLLSKIPKLKGTYPVVGFALKLMGNSQESMKALIECFPKEEPIVYTWIGPTQLWIFITKPEDYEIVFNNPSTMEKGMPEKILVKQFSPNGLLAAPVPIWKVHRKLISPGFNKQVLDSFMVVFCKQCALLADILEHQVDKNINMSAYLNKLAADTICETSLGINPETQIHDGPYLELFRTIDLYMDRVFKPIYYIDFIWNNTKSGRKCLNIIKYYQDFISSVIAEKRKMINDAPSDVTQKWKPFFERILPEVERPDGKLTEEDLNEETRIILGAGTDTTGVTMELTILLMAMHQDIQDKVYEEIMSEIGTKTDIEYEDIAKLEYMERVIKETMRLFPVGAFSVREATADVQLTDHVIPKGATIAISAIVTHRSPKYWKDPLKFNPDRFLPIEVSKRHPYTYIPFGMGPRNCIGLNYAMRVMKVALTFLIRKYRFETHYKTVEDIEYAQNFIIKPVHGSPVRITLRS